VPVSWVESRRDPPATPTTVADVSTAATDPLSAESQPRPVDDQFTPTDWSLFVAVATIWGSSFLFIDIGLDALPPGVITLMRVGLGASALAVVPRRRIRVDADDRLRVIALSIVWVAVPFTLFPIAEQHISSAVAGLLNGGTPIFAAIFAVVLFRQRTRGAQLLGIAIGFVGVVLVSLPSIGDGSSEAFGVAMVVAATVCYGLAVTIAAPLQRRYGSVNLMATVLALATIWTAPYGLWQLGDASWQTGPVLAVVVLGVLGTGVAFALMGNLVGRVGSTRASFITYLIPAVALVLGVAFRGDDVVALELVGIVLVIAGALLASRRVTARQTPTSAGRISPI
jgi:drug/metabolite transporter (DMT)-like permease